MRERELIGLFGRLKGMGLYVGGERESISVLFTQIKNNGKEIKKNLEHTWKLGTAQKEIKK